MYSRDINRREHTPDCSINMKCPVIILRIKVNGRMKFLGQTYVKSHSES